MGWGVPLPVVETTGYKMSPFQGYNKVDIKYSTYG